MPDAEHPAPLRPVDDRAVVDDVLVRVGRGDVGAFADLYDALAPVAFGLARRVLRDPDLAQEVTQEVFVELWRTGAGFDPARGSARSWVCTLAHRRAVDRVRHEEAARRRDHLHAVRDPRSGPTGGPEEAVVDGLAARVDGDRVHEALAGLSDVQRRAIELAYFGGLSYPQVAEALDVPLGTIKTRIRDGLTRLRAALGARS